MGHLLCVLAFALFFLGDANDWRWGKAALRLCFPAGLALLAAALVLLCLCLWGGFGLPFFTVILVTALNLGLVAFEDCRVFPAKLAGYGAYRQKTPFLIPTAASIRAMGRDLRERKNHRG